jgi:hypothetical protein
MKVYHPELASGRWFTFSIAEQLANVGSEYERARKAKEIGDIVSGSRTRLHGCLN